MEGESEMQAVEDAYRAALSGVAPDLLGKTTDRAFRQLVEDLLRLWTGSLSARSVGPTTGAVLFSRPDIHPVIAALIWNVVPSSAQSLRRRRYTRGLRLWSTLLKIVPEYEARR